MTEIVKFLPITRRFEDMSPGKLVCIAQIEKLSNKKRCRKSEHQKKSNKPYHNIGR